MKDTQDNTSKTAYTEADKRNRKALDTLATNIEQLCKEKSIPLSSLSSSSDSDINFGCSYRTVKNILRREANPNLYSLAAIAAKLDVEVSTLLQDPTSDRTLERDPTLCNIPKKDGDEFPLITNPSSAHMQVYLREYYTLFYSTSSDDNDLIRGQLDIYPDNDTCSATLILFTNNNIVTDNVYTGKFYVSDTLKTAYLILSNKHHHGIFFITFATYPRYDFIDSGLAIIGLCLCADLDGFPVSRRILLAENKEKIERNLDLIKGQLLMNTEKIYLTQEQADMILSIPNMPESVKDSINIVLKNQQKTHNYIIDETSLAFANHREKDKYISLIRALSDAPIDNKVAQITQNIISKIFSK